MSALITVCVLLGSLAINLAHKINRLNIRNNLTMHVVVPEDNKANNNNNYLTVMAQASAMAWHGLPQQFNDHERAELTRLVGKEVTHAPAIILGMNPSQLKVVNAGMGGQPIVQHEVPFTTVDPYSLTELSDIFEVDLSSIPLTPGRKGPDFPSLELYS